MSTTGDRADRTRGVGIVSLPANSGSPWATSATSATSATPIGGGPNVNLVEGTSFLVCGRSGAIADERAHGVFVLDTRVVSRWAVRVEGRELEPLSFSNVDPFSGVFVSRIPETGGEIDAPLVLIQRRHVGNGLREDLELRNHGPRCRLVLGLSAAADFAGLFEVKSGRLGGPASRVGAHDGGLDISSGRPGTIIERVRIRSSAPPTDVDVVTSTITWVIDLGPGEHWTTCLDVSAVTRTGGEIVPSHPCGTEVEHATPVTRMRRWRGRVARSRADDPVVERVVARSLEDLGSLRIFDPDHVDRMVVAAGAPWFMALFGRDSLLTSWMAMPFDRELAAGVLAELADTQGREIDAQTEEEPGRILHEVRFDPLTLELLGGSNRYYGTVDATPLFVMLVGELARWEGLSSRVRALLPAVDRALEWIDRFGDRDGDGFVEYGRADEHGLEHQGWKDSWDGIRHRDGTVATPPIALCEVQGYVFAAFRARAALARSSGDHRRAEHLDDRAAELADRFDRAFWMPDLGTYAVGLDHAKQQIRSVTSNVGHLLWTGIVPTHRAPELARSLRSPALFSGFGLRTLAADEVGYNPLSYHCGSVWPHDTALAVAGLARYGFHHEAATIGLGLFDAADLGGGRLPELFGGFARDDVGAPVPYPTSCSPQAWSAASALLVVRSLLGLDPDLLSGRIEVCPRVPERLGTLRLVGVRVGDDLVDVIADGDVGHVEGATVPVSIS